MKPYFEDESVTIYHGDCRELLDDMPRVDLVLTDPPYGIKYDPNRHPTKHPGAQKFETPAWDQTPFDPSLICGIDSKLIIWGADCFSYGLPHPGAWLCWDKVTRNNGHARASEFELAWTNFMIRPRMFRHLWVGGYRESESGVRNYHPTQKPLVLMRWCLGFVSDAKLILDPYMGSGTTLRAAKDMGIKAIGVEIEERYCEIAAKRMAQQVLAYG